MTDAIIAVFEAVLDRRAPMAADAAAISGLTVAVTNIATSINGLVQQIASDRAANNERFERIEAALRVVRDDTAGAGNDRGDMLRGEIRTIARIYQRANGSRSYASWRAMVESKIRAAVGYASGARHSFDAMPLDLWERAINAARAERVMAEKIARTAWVQQPLSIARKAS
jgi:hypothetical protein